MQYANHGFRDVLTRYGITSSTSRRGNCWDNAYSETPFDSLTVERLHGQCFESRRQAKDEVIDWLLWYNRDRLHPTLAYVSRCSSKKTGLPITSTSPLMTPAMEYGIQGRGQVAPGLNCLPEVGKTSRGL